MQQQPANSHDGSHQPTDPLNPTLLPVPPPISLSPPLLFVVVVVVVATFNSHNGRRHPHEAQDHRPRRALRRYVSRSLCTSFPPPLTRSAGRSRQDLARHKVCRQPVSRLVLPHHREHVEQERNLQRRRVRLRHHRHRGSGMLPRSSFALSSFRLAGKDRLNLYFLLCLGRDSHLPAQACRRHTWLHPRLLHRVR